MTTHTLPIAAPVLPCCEPVVHGEIDAASATVLAQVFRALGDPTRLRLLSLIATQPDAQACVCDLTAAVGLKQPTVSHHMKQLVGAGLVVREQRGKWAYYRVREETLEVLRDALRPSAGEADISALHEGKSMR
ncbi:MAG: metalloregulator ArsR/SmtB family transcription factor [Nitriliruptoraceae bacterium]